MKTTSRFQLFQATRAFFNRKTACHRAGCSGPRMIYMNFLFLFLIICHYHVFSQTPAFDPRVNCVNGCTAKDIKNITAALVFPTPPNAQLPANFFCENGENVNVKLAVFLTTNTQKAGLYVYANIRNSSTNALIGTVSECFSTGALTTVLGATKVVFSQVVTWSCGTAIKLTDVYVAWGTGTDDFCAGSPLPRCPATTSKCFAAAAGEYIPVVIPVGTNSDASKCPDVPGGTTATFNLHNLDESVLAGQTGIVTYYENQNFTGAIAPNESAYVSTSKTIWAKITSNNVSSSAIEITLTVKTSPTAPGVTVVNNCNGTSDLTATGYTGTLLWSTGASTSSINVNNAATYTVKQTVNGCPSANGSGTSAPKTTPTAPGVTVVNNCDGTSDLTATGYTGTLLWSTGASTSSINVNNAATYTVKQTVNGCPSANGSGTSAPKTTPAAPGVTVVNNCNGTSDLTATGYTGTLLWSTGASTSSINVNNAATYTVKQTVNGCPSANGSGTSAPKTTPAAPGVTVVNNCNGTSDLTATGYTGTLLWSTGASTSSINVNNAATYTVKQTVDGCPSANGSGTSAPKTTPAAPGVTVVNNCDGTSDLTATGYTGTLLWSTGASTSSIKVNNAATYTVKQTVNGCPSANGSGTSAPKSTPSAPQLCVIQPSLCGPTTGTVKVLSGSAGDEYSLNDGAWQSSNEFTGLAAGSNPSIKVKNAGGCISAPTNCTSASICAPSAPAERQSAPAQQQKNSITKEPSKTIIAFNDEESTVVKAFPNPFSDKVKFVINSTVSGQGDLILYNQLGQKVRTVYSGRIVTGTQTIELNIPEKQNANYVYILSVAGKRITGKLMQLNQ